MLSAHPQATGRTIYLASATGPVDASGVLSPLGALDLSVRSDSFLGVWQDRNTLVTIPHCIDNLESSGVLQNFRRVISGEQGDHVGMWFSDSDLYKTLEAIGWESLRVGHPLWTAFTDSAIELITGAQDADGYLNTHIQGDPNKSRWNDLAMSHELYCAGHLFQAAVALSRGCRDDRLLKVSLAFADRIIEDLAGREDAFDGHAEVETALVELYRLTHRTNILDLAQSQAERRGHRRLASTLFSPEYFGDHRPFREVDTATGHAVRQLYYSTGLVDLFLEDGDTAKLEAAERVWDSAYSKKTYVTGGQGSRHSDEAFGDDFELPPDRAYAETCAGIASFQWNWRMLLATADGKYAEAMETALYNVIAASVDDEGNRFFYTNPLQMRTGHVGARDNSPTGRLSWFDCACCPPNLARLIASLQSYLATRSQSGLQIHLLTAGVITTVIDGKSIEVDVRTGFPWAGSARVIVSAEHDVEVSIRVGGARVTTSGEELSRSGADGYVRFVHRGQRARTTEYLLDFDLSIEIVRPHTHIDAVRGCVALKRGPFVYCIEGADNPSAVLEDLRILDGAAVAEVQSELPGVEIALTVDGSIEDPGVSLSGAGTAPAASLALRLTAIPYFAWGNRGETAMRVWIPVSSAPPADRREATHT